MVADNCRLSCQLDTLVLLTNRSAKLIRKCCKSGNYGYHFSLEVIYTLNRNKLENNKNIDYIIEKYGKTQNCIYFNIIEPKYTNEQIKRVKNIFLVIITTLFLSIFLFKNNGKYAIAIFAILFVTYIILNKILSRFESVGELSFYKDHLEIKRQNSSSQIEELNYIDIINITSIIGLDELFKSPRRPTPLISLIVTFHTEKDKYELNVECVPFNKIFDGNSHRYKIWVENILKTIDENYLIKDITRLKENAI